MRRELLMTMKIQSGEIILQNLRFHAFHGVIPQERFVGNDYVLNLRISYPLAAAARVIKWLIHSTMPTCMPS